MVTDSAKQPDMNSPSFARLAWPGGILLVEATALTPFVEFTAGGMAWLANPLMLSALIVTLATFFLLLACGRSTPSVELTAASLDPAADTTASVEPRESLRQSFAFWLRQPWHTVHWSWLLTHVLLLGIFVWLTFHLHTKNQNNSTIWFLPTVWIAFVLGVAFTIVRAFLSLAQAVRLARRYALQAVVAGLIGVSLLVMITPMRNLWTSVDGPMLVVLEEMFNLYPGHAHLDTISYRWPVIGASQISLLVTAPCSELESLLVFVLLGGTLWVAKWEDLSPWKFPLVLATGICSIYLLLIFRLYMLVVIGVWANDPYVSVGMAHSRVSTLFLLIFSLVFLFVGSKLTRRSVPAEFEPESLTEAEAEPAKEQPEEPTETLVTNHA